MDAKSGALPKDAVTALTAIVKAAQDYRAELDECVTSARKALTARISTQSAAQKGAASGAAAKPDAESKGAKLVRSRALDAIRSLRKPVKGAKPLQFLVVQGKTTVTTYLGPSAGPTQEKILRSLIPNDAPFHVFKDPQGQLLWEKNAVTIVSDKLPAGLAKKMQAWLKKILKLNLRLRVRRTNGEVEETEGEDLPADLPATAEDGAAARQQAQDELEARLAELAPAIKAALTGPPSEFAGDLRELIALFKAHVAPGSGRDLGAASDDLDDIEAALDDRGDAGDGLADPSAAEDALAGWRAACAEVRTQIRRLEGEIVKFQDPQSTAAVIQLESVVKNLAGVPASQRQVLEIEAWLRDDEVVDRVEQPNPWDLPVEVRSKLLPLLSALKTHLPA